MRCEVSGVRCQIYIYIFIYFYKAVDLVVEVLLSMGPTPSSFNSDMKVRHP